MADSASSPATLEPKPESIAPNSQPTQPDPVPHSASPSPSPAPVAAPNPNSNPSLLSTPLPPPPPPQLHPTVSYAAAPPQILPPAVASFRPLPPQAPQFSPLPIHSGAPNLSYQNPSVQPPGVSSTSAMAPGSTPGVAVPMSVPPPIQPMQPMMSYQAPPGQPAIPPFRAYAPLMPNGYAAVPAPQGTVPPAVY